MIGLVVSSGTADRDHALKHARLGNAALFTRDFPSQVGPATCADTAVEEASLEDPLRLFPDGVLRGAWPT